jgi:ParB/RepB/Spo0J family partition protein
MHTTTDSKSIATSVASLPAELIKVALIDASPLNPRKDFPEEKLRALGESMATQGQLEALLVRSSKKNPGRYELANGERRWRAAQLVGILELVAKVCDMTDADMVERALAIGAGDNVEALSVLEESNGLVQLMKLRGWTEREMAEHLGRSVTAVARLLALQHLPAKARAALEDGRLGTTVAYYLASIPNAETREATAKGILESEIHGGVMPKAAALTYIRDHVCRSLRNVPFDMAAADLVPEAGACTNCPWRAGANQEKYGDIYDAKARGGVDKCMNPACFEQKIEAHRVRLLAKVAVDGKVPLSKDENKRVFPPQEKGVHFASDFVPYNERPSPDLLKKEVAPSSVPTWREMTAGREVKVFVGMHQDGHAVELVKRDEALAAADLNERKVFNEAEVKRGTVTKPDRSAAEASRVEQEREEKAARAKAEKAQRKKDTAAASFLREIADNMLPPNKDSAAGLVLWTLLYDLAVERLTAEEIAFVVRAWDQDVEEGKRNRAGLDELGGQMGVRELQALVVMMSLAPRVRAEGAEGELANEWWSALCAVESPSVAGEDGSREGSEGGEDETDPEVLLNQQDGLRYEVEELLVKTGNTETAQLDAVAKLVGLKKWDEVQTLEHLAKVRDCLKRVLEVKGGEKPAEPERLPTTVDQAIIDEETANAETDFDPEQVARFASWFCDLHVTTKDGAPRLRTEAEHLGGEAVLALVKQEQEADVRLFIEWLTTGPRRKVPGTAYSAADLHNMLLAHQHAREMGAQIAAAKKPKAKKAKREGAK